MDSRTKKGVVPRTRISSNSKSARQTSTPTSGVQSKGNNTESFNFTPIKNPDVSQPSINNKEGREPRLMKPLGPTVESKSHQHVVKNSTKKEKEKHNEKVLLWYAAVQQQQFRNALLKEAKERVLTQGKEQLESLWHMVKYKEQEVAETEYRIKLVEKHTCISNLVNEIEPVFKETKSYVEQVTVNTQELAHRLDGVRHKIRLVNINPVKKQEDLREIKQLVEKTAVSANEMEILKMGQSLDVASSISRLDYNMSNILKVMEGVQRLSSVTIQRLGQQLALSEETVEFKKLSELDV